jgi:hypothetical protein
MYSQLGGWLGDVAGRPILDVDIFGIPAAFLHGLLGYRRECNTVVTVISIQTIVKFLSPSVK